MPPAPVAVAAGTVQPGPPSESGSLTDDGEARDAFKVPEIVGDQWQRAADGAGGDPEIVIADEPVRAAGCPQAILDPCVGPTNAKVIWDYDGRCDLLFEAPEPHRSPFSPLGPIIELSHSYERNDQNLVQDMRTVQFSPRITPAQEIREDIGIEENFIHIGLG